MARRILGFVAMRNASSPVAAALYRSHVGWRAPALYLFMGVAGMLALIGFASILLVCTWCRLATGSMNDSTQNSPSIELVESGPLKPEIVRAYDEQEPGDKVLVIMPGDQQPRFLAKQLDSVPDSAEDQG